MEGWELDFYQTSSGRIPVREYLDHLDASEAEQVLHDIRLLKELGTELGFPYVSHIAGKLWELRTRGRNQHRVLYFVAVGARIVLLHAFTKKTAKAPRREVETAQRRMVDFTERFGK